MSPDAGYSGGMTWAGTGIQFSSDPATVKSEIALLKQKNPNTKVMVAVGGATYTNFAALNATSIANFVKTFGLDGVDIDYEPVNAGCTVKTGGLVSCLSDSEYIATVSALRAALPRPQYTISAAVWSIGAYGQGAWATAIPQGQYTGVAINMLKAVGTSLDLLNVMSYDAGGFSTTGYDPKQALDAYRSYFKGEILMGVEVANEAWGGHVTTMTEVGSLADYVMGSGGGNGLMLWSIQKPADQGPTALQISQLACNKFGLTKCTCGVTNCA